MKLIASLFLACLISMQALASPAEDREALLDAIQQVETGGHPDPANAVGDKGKALGPYQIHRSYWSDAVERHPDLKALGYDSVRDRAVARRVVLAYWARYAPKGATLEDLARIHNGGPKGHKKQATLGYWAKVRAAMQ